METLRVLIVEDNQNDFDLVLRALKVAGFDPQYIRVVNSDQMMRALEHELDIVLSDYVLPGFSGVEALAMTRARLRDLPFIVVSGTIGEEAAVDMMLAGANDYVMKDNLIRLQVAIRRELDVARTHKKNQEIQKTLKETEDQLRQSQKMEAIGQLAGGVAHDFNNILTVIQAYCEKLLQVEDEKIHNYAEKIFKAHKRAASLTKQLLIFSRKQVAQPKILQINRIILDFQDMLQRLLNEDIELKLNLDQAAGDLNIDPGHIEQVIMNLAVNARDAMPKGGQLTITTKGIKPDDPVFTEKPDLPKGPCILLQVQDSGCGMNKDVVQRIFEPFFTTKEIGKGTGLGLSIVYGIIHQNQGRIFVHSEEGQGTRFDMYLPAITETQPQPETQSVKPKEKNIGTETILIVEDEPELREVICEILTDSGYKILIAQDGFQAFEMWEKNKKAIKLIMTDVVMPKMGGVDLHYKVSQENKDMKFLYMSGHAAVTMATASKLLTEMNFIEKPFSAEDLLKKIRRVLDS